MKITEMTVTAAVTANLGDFNNTKPEITLRATLEPGDDVEECRNALYHQARAGVEAIVDDELMKQGSPPKYYRGTRYDVRRIQELNVIAVVAPEVPFTRIILPWSVQRVVNGFPLEQSLEAAQRYADNDAATVITINSIEERDAFVAQHQQPKREPSPLDAF